MFEKTFGKPAARPESYWRPWLGHFCALRPEDVGDLTPAQLNACFDFVPKD